MNQTRALAGSVSRSFSSLSLSLCFYELFLERCLSRAIPRAESASRFDVCDRRDSNGIKTIIRPTCKRPPSFLRPPFAAFHYPREIESADQLPRPLARLLSGEGGGGRGRGEKQILRAREESRARENLSSTESRRKDLSPLPLSLSLSLFPGDRSRSRFRARIGEKKRPEKRTISGSHSAAPYPRGLVFIRFAIQSRGIPRDIREHQYQTVVLRSPPQLPFDISRCGVSVVARDSPESSERIIQPKRQVHCLELRELIWITLV
jgi:hypothetical protein